MYSRNSAPARRAFVRSVMPPPWFGPLHEDSTRIESDRHGPSFRRTIAGAKGIATSGGIRGPNGGGVGRTAERRVAGASLHLAEQVQVAPTHRKHLLAAPEMDVRRLPLAARHMTDGPEIDDDRSVHLSEEGGIQLGRQLLERHAHQRVGKLAGVVPPRNPGVL